MPRPDARFSTYSGAPSLQPSLAPTLDNTSTRSSSHPYHPSRFGEQTSLPPRTIPEQGGGGGGRTIYASADTTADTNDAKTADILSFATLLDRMNDTRTDKQRFVMSRNKTDEINKIALCAKLERALARRMVGQDAVFRIRPKKPSTILDEKRALEVPAN